MPDKILNNEDPWPFKDGDYLVWVYRMGVIYETHR